MIGVDDGKLWAIIVSLLVNVSLRDINSIVTIEGRVVVTFHGTLAQTDSVIDFVGRCDNRHWLVKLICWMITTAFHAKF